MVMHWSAKPVCAGSIPALASILNLNVEIAMSEPTDDPEKEGFPTHIPMPDSSPNGSPLFGAVLSFISIILLSFILRLAVPKEDSELELAILLFSIGFAQIWLIFILLKSLRK